MKLDISPEPPFVVIFKAESQKSHFLHGIPVQDEVYYTAKAKAHQHIHTCYGPDEEYARYIDRGHRNYNYTFYLGGGVVQVGNNFKIIHDTREGLDSLVKQFGFPETEHLPLKPHMTMDERQEEFFRRAQLDKEISKSPAMVE